MTALELRATGALAAIFFVRMLALFMVLPVLGLYAEHMPGASPLLIGLALGSYGLTQALCQLPLGAASDRLGRKRVILGSLGAFALGSVIAATSSHILGIILGRALQGLGAVSSPAMALAADLTRESQRTKAMAVIGISIGLAFAASFVVGPWLDGRYGLSGLFWIATALALGAGTLLVTAVPDPPHTRFEPGYQPVLADAAVLVRDARLLPLNIGIFLLHAILSATFVAVPVLLRDRTGLPAAGHAWVYLPVLAVSLLLLLPLIRLADRSRRGTLALHIAIALLCAGLLLVPLLADRSWSLMCALVLFFTGFNYLEAGLPALVSRAAPPLRRGTALGVFATCQFGGSFAGALAGGALAQFAGHDRVCLAAGAVAALWLAFSLRRLPATG